jgi:hypothetical protein
LYRPSVLQGDKRIMHLFDNHMAGGDKSFGYGIVYPAPYSQLDVILECKELISVECFPLNHASGVVFIYAGDSMS